jgi:hypothetical protein
MYVDFIVVSESEIALNTRAWKLSRSRDARVGIVITRDDSSYIYITKVGKLIDWGDKHLARTSKYSTYYV